MADGELSDRVAAVQRLAASRDPRAAELIRALADERVKFAGDRVYIVNGPTDTEATDALTGQSAPLPPEAQDAMLNNRLRGALEPALAALDLADPSPARQTEAARTLQRSAFDNPDPAQLPMLDAALATELPAAARTAAR